MKSLLLFLSMLPLSLCAQNAVSFDYDAAGNRTSTQNYVVRLNSASEESSTQRMTDWQVTVYPNPTKGHLTVKILNFTDDHECSLAIYTVSGHEVMSRKVVSECTELDISSYSNGVYIMRIRIDGEDKSWKIIKEA